MSIVRTVRGDIDPASLGVTDSHDHLFFRSPLLPGAELDDVDLARAEASAFAAAGGGAIVQWTPRGLGRRRHDLVNVSIASGVHVISATGRHRAEHHRHAPAVTDALTAAFVDDINAAVAPCGLIKVGTGYHHLDPWEASSLDAAAAAHRVTGAPIAVHLELGTAGDLVIDRLSRRGVAATSVVLGHVGRDPESRRLIDLAQTGAFLCFDGPSRANHRTDWRTPECIEMLVERGHLGQLLVGGDTTTAAARSVTAGPGMSGLLQRFMPLVEQRVGAVAVRSITVVNPGRAYALAEHGQVGTALPSGPDAGQVVSGG